MPHRRVRSAHPHGPTGQSGGRAFIKVTPGQAGGLRGRTLTFYAVSVDQGWEVILEPEVSTWILDLRDDTYDRVGAAIDM